MIYFVVVFFLGVHLSILHSTIPKDPSLIHSSGHCAVRLLLFLLRLDRFGKAHTQRRLGSVTGDTSSNHINNSYYRWSLTPIVENLLALLSHFKTGAASVEPSTET